MCSCWLIVGEESGTERPDRTMAGVSAGLKCPMNTGILTSCRDISASRGRGWRAGAVPGDWLRSCRVAGAALFALLAGVCSAGPWLGGSRASR